MLTNELREKVLLVIDQQLNGICNDILEDGCVSHNNSALLVPISTLCDLLGVEPCFQWDYAEPGGDGEGAAG